MPRKVDHRHCAERSPAAADSLPRSALSARRLLYVVIGIATLAGCGSPSESDGKSGGGDVTLEVLDVVGVQGRIASHKDKKIVVVDYWSTSCPPCMKEFPGLVALSEKHPDDVACISVSLDYEGGKNKKPADLEPKVLNFLTSLAPQPKRVDNVLCGTPSDEVLSDATLNLGGSPPVVVVYGRDGTVAKMFENGSADSEDEYFTYADVRKLVEELLAAETAKK
ncbi:MAG: TlpA disulfide reductase family protein [Pirellulales bacterium]